MRIENKNQIVCEQKLLLMLMVAFVSCISFSSKTSAEEMNQSNTATFNIKNRENKTLDLLSRIDAFSEEDPNLKMDAAKAHYNMGNIYFEKGEFEIAVREYYQAVTLMPDDPDAHFNLAFVSGEYLNDQTTALKHYQLYLYLKPNADDVELVNEKIVNAKLILDSRIEAKIDTQQ